MSPVLTIDTTDNKRIAVSISTGNKKNEISSSSTILKSEIALPLIDKVLKENSLLLEQISEVRVNTGPGSYTGIRVGVSIANILGYLLKIPINGKKIGELAKPVYNK